MTEVVPVTLLTGFLGSGKTTLLNRVLSERSDERIAVVVNELGEVGIDGGLVVGAADEVVELSNGCLCCTVRGDLATTIGRLLERRRRRLGRVSFDRILIETSGMASPGPVAQTVGLLGDEVALDGVVTLAHAARIADQLERHPEAAEQVGYADRIVLNACDLATAAEVAAAEGAVAARNALAPVRRAVRAAVPVGPLLAIGGRDPGAWDLASAAEGAALHGEGAVRTVTLRADRPLDIHRLKMWVQFVAARRTHEVLRVKGILACRGLDRAVVLQGVYQWLELGPGEAPPPDESLLVVIGRDLDADELRRGWATVLAG